MHDIARVRLCARYTTFSASKRVAANVGAGKASNMFSCAVLYPCCRRRPSPGGSSEELGYFQPLGDPGHDVEGRGGVFTLK